MKRSTLCSALVCAAALAACGGGGSSTPSSSLVVPITPTPTPTASATATPTATPTPTPTPAPVLASPASVAFASNAATTLSVSESGYTGTFHESDTCTPLTGAIATVSAAASPPAGSATYSVAPVGPGTCQITVADGTGRTITVPVTVSTAAVTVQ